MKVVETRYPCPVCLGVMLEKLHIAHEPAKVVWPDAAISQPSDRPGAAGSRRQPLKEAQFRAESRSAPPAASRRGKATPAPQLTGELVLDHCNRCGGVWFGAGEVQQLGRVDPARLWALIARRSDVYRMQCHNCHLPVARNEHKCSNCGWNLALDCPVCQRAMEQAEQPLRARPLRSEHAQSPATGTATPPPLPVRLDVCRRCKGVWFDHDELEAIWRLEVHALAQRRRAGEELSVGSVALLEALTYDPFLMYFGIQAAGHALGGAAQVLSGASGALANAPEAAVGVMEAAGEAASSVFETIVEIIASIFE